MLVNGLQSQFSLGNNQYPKMIVHTTDILANHRHDNYKAKCGMKKQDEKTNNDKEGDNGTPKRRNKVLPKMILCVSVVARMGTRATNARTKIRFQGLIGLSISPSSNTTSGVVMMMKMSP